MSAQLHLNSQFLMSIVCRGLALINVYPHTFNACFDQTEAVVTDKQTSVLLCPHCPHWFLCTCVSGPLPALIPTYPTLGFPQGISDIIMIPGLINVDFADVRSIMSNSGTAMLGVGRASGKDRAEKAALAATYSPLIQSSVERATGAGRFRAL